jgi:hypothetical protein
MVFILNFIAIWLGAILTYELSFRYKQGAVRASALVGVLIGLVYYIFPQWFAGSLTKEIPFIMFGGSFIGMVSAEKHIHIPTLTLSVLIFALLYSLKSNELNGIGGLLGITALISIIASVGVFILLDKIKN